jgi:hypothetical protein
MPPAARVARPAVTRTRASLASLSLLLLPALAPGPGCGPRAASDAHAADAAADAALPPLALPALPLDSVARIDAALAGGQVSLTFEGPAVVPTGGLGVVGPGGTVHLVFTDAPPALAATLYGGEDRLELFSVWQLWSPDVELVRLWIGPGALDPAAPSGPASFPLTNPFLTPPTGAVAILASAPPPGTPGAISMSAAATLDVQSWEPPPAGGGGWGRLRATIPPGAALFVFDQVSGGLLDPATVRAGAVSGAIDVGVVDPADFIPAPRPLESGLSLVAEVPLEWADADVWGDPSGTVAYLAANATAAGFPTFHVVDLADPAAPVVVTRSGLGYGKDVETEGDVLYVAVQPDADSPGGVHVFDATDPLDPQPLAFLSGPPLDGLGVHNLFVDGTVLWATAGAAGFQLYDVTSPAAPVWLSEIPVPPGVGAVAHDMAIVGTTAYLATLKGGVLIADVTVPAAPVVIGAITYPGAFSHNAYPTADSLHVLVTDEYAGGHVRVFDVSDLAAPVQVAVLPPPRRNAVAHNVYVDGTRAVVSYYLDGVRIYDVADPAAPVLSAFYETVRSVPPIGGVQDGATFGVWAPALSGGAGPRLFASDSFRGLLVLQ